MVSQKSQEGCVFASTFDLAETYSAAMFFVMLLLCKFDVGCKLFSFVTVAVFQNECIFFGSEAKSRHGGDEAKYN